ncbi:MAG TPA: phytanoyl-CoA dioxygenase family protein [Pyrinomonadaceae bacterium]|nr:phytanoyl-CoA dioxygenase family protein [Pyrinomonadaceae bacterium]
MESPQALTATLSQREREIEVASRLASVDALASELETNGIVVLPSLVSPETLREMQDAFAVRLTQVRWNNFDGYARTEVYRLMIEDVLMLAQGFVDVAIHPLVKEIVARYLGPTYQLTEAKGWKSLPTKYDFHGWHGDRWYEQTPGAPIHREVKLGMYLTDVRSGAFNLLKATHQQEHPHSLKKDEVNALPLDQVMELSGVAGTAFLFDTSIVHRQGIPMLEPRQAIFYAYHDPSVALQQEDIDYYRYHPLLLNAAFLGNLSAEDERLLGFGDKRNYQPAFVRQGKPTLLHRIMSASIGAQTRLELLRRRISARLQRLK